MHGAAHPGVNCDGCGMAPLTGPRFKSLTQVDYDLSAVAVGRSARSVFLPYKVDDLVHDDMLYGSFFLPPRTVVAKSLQC